MASHASDLVEVSMVLEMPPPTFERVRSQFLSDFARILDVDESDVEILEVRQGCTWLLLKIPRSATNRFDSVGIPAEQIPTELREEFLRFIREYAVANPDDFPHAEFKIRIMTSGRTLTWLHLSDLHMRDIDDDNHAEQGKVAETFLAQLSQLLAEKAIEPDMVFFTGDVAQSGKASEYDAAFTFIDSLRNRLPYPECMVYCVPGNHDVHRNTVTEFFHDEERVAASLVDNRSIIRFLTAPGCKHDRPRIFARLQNYMDFHKKLLKLCLPDIEDVSEELNHDWFYTRPIWSHAQDGILLGIAGLNSAWRCGSDEDRGSLILGVPQLDAAVNDLGGDAIDLKIMCVHHPIDSDWFMTPDIEYQRTILPQFDFVLRGHEHDPVPKFSKSSFGEETTYLSAGALHTSDTRPNSFNAVRLNLDEGTGIVYFWRMASEQYKWVPHVELGGDGEVQFELSARTVERIARRKRIPVEPDLEGVRPLRVG